VKKLLKRLTAPLRNHIRDWREQRERRKKRELFVEGIRAFEELCEQDRLRAREMKELCARMKLHAAGVRLVIRDIREVRDQLLAAQKRRDLAQCEELNERANELERDYKVMIDAVKRIKDDAHAVAESSSLQ
jgi:hypothetical protein